MENVALSSPIRITIFLSASDNRFFKKKENIQIKYLLNSNGPKRLIFVAQICVMPITKRCI